MPYPVGTETLHDSGTVRTSQLEWQILASRLMDTPLPDAVKWVSECVHIPYHRV
ncbi:MAG: hypothetical protein N3C57_08130 [Aquificaceae bacterium]|nr:hypothetical protein [Aquificaceae bacterium]